MNSQPLGVHMFNFQHEQSCMLRIPHGHTNDALHYCFHGNWKQGFYPLHVVYMKLHEYQGIRSVALPQMICFQ